jgi:uncharacterized protein (DUF488 family)
MKLYTVGYEGETQAGVIQRLLSAGVKVVADVRAVAASRRAGFSKTILASSLREAGIDYVHLRALGTPKSGRDAARAGRIGEMRTIFVDHMKEPASQIAFEQLRELARSRPTALLCFEADHAGCHRSVLSERLREADGFEVKDL